MTGRRLRIAVVTPNFPIREEPHRGVFIYRTVWELQRLAEVEVYCPVAVYPRWQMLRPASYRNYPVDPAYSPPGVRARYFDYPTLPVIGRPMNAWMCARRLLPFCQQSRPDVVLAYWIYPEGRAALSVGRRLGVPVIIGSRGSDMLCPPDRWSFRRMRKTLREASFVLTVTEHMRRRALELGVSPERIKAIANGCDGSIFRPADRQGARAELGVDAGAELILFVGRLVPVKGVGDLLAAVERLRARRPRIELALIGDGPLRREFENMVASAALARHVRFVGARPAPEVARWMAAADLVCLPSHSEGCPNVVLEALSCGRPVVASKVGGLPEMVSSACGLLVPPGNPPALAAALSEALARAWDPASIAEQFHRGWDQVAAETHEVCRQVLALPGLQQQPCRNLL